MEREPLNAFMLSKVWHEWAADNPSRIKPNHGALYFYCIDLCNRLHWPKSFQLPTDWAKNTIGLRHRQTYTNTLHDLVDFGFISLIEKSKNQYSANIIALTNFVQAPIQATVQATVQAPVNHMNHNKTIKNNIKLSLPQAPWRESFDDYRKDLNGALQELLNDKAYIEKQEKFNPGTDIRLSLQKAVENFWGTTYGWENKKKSKTQNIDWKSTLANAIPKNKVAKNNNANNDYDKQKFKYHEKVN